MGNRYCERGEIVAVSCEGRATDPASPTPALVYPLFPQQGETEPLSSKGSPSQFQRNRPLAERRLS